MKNKNELQQYVGKTVTLILYDKTKLYGELHRIDSDEFRDQTDLYKKKGYYTLTYPHSNVRIGEYLFKEDTVRDLKIATGF